MASSQMKLIKSLVKPYNKEAFLLLTLGGTLLEKGEYAMAVNNFGTLISYLLENESKNLTDKDIFSLKCCHLYCLVWTNSISIDFSTLNTEIKLPLVSYLKAIVSYLNGRYVKALDEIAIAEELLKNGYNFKPNYILNEKLIPEVNETIIKKQLSNLRAICVCESVHKLLSYSNTAHRKEDWYATISPNDNMERFEKLLPYSFCDICIHYHMNTLHYNLLHRKTQGSILPNNKPLKLLKHISTQTETPKQETIINPRLMVDIQARLTNLLHEKQNEIDYLRRKYEDLQITIKSIENRHGSIVDNLKMKLNDSQTKITFLTSKLTESEEKCEKCNTEILKFRTLLQQQVNQHYLTQTNIFKMLDETCKKNVDFFIDIENYNISNNEELIVYDLKEFLEWTKLLKDIKQAKTAFNDFYKKFEGAMLNNLDIDYTDTTDNYWPTIPDIPLNINKIMLRSFKRTADNMKTLKENFQTKAPIGSNQAKPQPSTSRAGIDDCDTEDNCNTLSTYKHHKFEKILLEYLSTEFEEIEETQLYDIILQIQDNNEGTLFGLKREILERQIRRLLTPDSKDSLSSKKLDKSILTSSLIEEECCICLNIINKEDRWELNCKHLFHKECIVKWFQRRKECPLCRLRIKSKKLPKANRRRN